MKLSIVTALYKSADTVLRFHEQATRYAKDVTPDYEIIFVNDGSPDTGIEKALALFAKDTHVKVIDLARNFGQHPAFLTGLEHASGDLIFMIDADGDEDMAWLPLFHKRMAEEKADVVYGQIRSRKGFSYEKAVSGLFYRFFSLLTYYDVPADTTTARLMTRRFLNSLLQHKERSIFLAGLMHMTGYGQVPMAVDKKDRGASGYSFGKRLALAVDAVSSFSHRPLVFIFSVGILVSVLAGFYTAYLISRYVLYGIPVPGWTTVVVSVWFVGGLTFLFLGVIGIYLSRIYLETKARPLTIVKEVHDHGAARRD